MVSKRWPTKVRKILIKAVSKELNSGLPWVQLKWKLSNVVILSTDESQRYTMKCDLLHFICLNIPGYGTCIWRLE